MNTFFTQLAKDYPAYRFIRGKRFSFRPPKTIVLGPDEGEKTPLLALHELGHALSGQYRYDLAVDRLKIEVAAWSEAKKVHARYLARGLSLPAWDDDFVEDQLDSYRDWLHSKSKCKSCGLTMYQTPGGSWHCPRCESFTA